MSKDTTARIQQHHLMDDFLTFDDGLFESNERTKGLLPVFHPNEVGNLEFLSGSGVECLKSSSDWFYLSKKYDDCLEYLLQLWDRGHSYNGFPKRIIADAIVRCYLKLNKQCELLPYLQQHSQLSVSYEDYIGHLMLHFTCSINETTQGQINLLQRILLALPPSFVDDSSTFICKNLFTQSQLWIDLSVAWDQMETETRTMFYPVWFSKVALLYAELVNTNPKLNETSLTWTDKVLNPIQIEICHKLSLRILTTCSSSGSSSTNPSSTTTMVDKDNGAYSHENNVQFNDVTVTHVLPYIPSQKCCSIDTTVDTNNQDEVGHVFFQLFVAPFMNIYEKSI
uniref:Rab-GAP TBC domain-containing protein n=2 Tax=Schistosoma mansoni TaxID=6183 RepID=A0A3Q0KQN4_SCHMA